MFKSTFPLLERVNGARSLREVRVYTEPEALNRHRDAMVVASKPLICLAAGVSNPEFIEDLEFAAKAALSLAEFCADARNGKMGVLPKVRVSA